MKLPNKEFWSTSLAATAAAALLAIGLTTTAQALVTQAIDLDFTTATPAPTQSGFTRYTCTANTDTTATQTDGGVTWTLSGITAWRDRGAFTPAPATQSLLRDLAYGSSGLLLKFSGLTPGLTYSLDIYSYDDASNAGIAQWRYSTTGLTSGNGAGTNLAGYLWEMNNTDVRNASFVPSPQTGLTAPVANQPAPYDVGRCMITQSFVAPADGTANFFTYGSLVRPNPSSQGGTAFAINGWQLSQPDSGTLVINAGTDQTVIPSAPSVMLRALANGGTGSYSTYSWSPSTGLSDTTVSNPIATPSTTTTYTVTVTDSLGATASDEVTVTYTVPPLVANAGNDKTYNPGTPVAIGGSPAASGGSTVYTYSWSPADGLSSTSVPNPTASPTSTTTYTLTVTDSFGTTPATDDVTVTYTVLPLVAYAGADQTVAAGIPATLGGTPTAAGGSTIYTYSWSPTTGLDDPSAAHPVASPTTTTTYTLTVTDSFGTTPATDEVLVTFGVPNVNLISVDFYKLGGVPCAADTTLTGTTMKNAVGQIFTGQIGPWNALNIGSYSTNTALSGFLKNAAGTTTTVKLALGLATGLNATAAGGWRCNPNEGSPGGSDKLRSESAYLYNGVVTGDHYAWALTGLTANGAYKLVWFGDLGNAGGASNLANSVAGTRDSEGDWNWDSVTADASGTILGTFTAPNPTLGLYGVQIESIGSGASGYDTWASANADSQAADLDYDHDGMSNGVEYFMGATGSSFTPNPPVVNTAGVLTVTWPRDPAATAPFMVQVSDNLTAWTDIVPPDASINQSIPSQVTYTLPGGGAKKFCRLVVTP